MIKNTLCIFGAGILLLMAYTVFFTHPARISAVENKQLTIMKAVMMVDTLSQMRFQSCQEGIKFLYKNKMDKKRRIK